ncbi:hypothetical protein COJ36_02845 [Priestia megaterium]|uniref:acyltransferase n=1 Tax=Priestia megaterium TaxID=1404 RepID=UPI000BF53C5B|nr:acyltransferase [Priestia megaterium]PFL70507.1 hypothetical protein COJ36_02845 [Priestia megaterium]
MFGNLMWRVQRFRFLLKGYIYKSFMSFQFKSVGANLRIRQFPRVRYPHNNLIIGKNVFIGERITFDVPPTGKLIIGNDVNLTQDIIISANQHVEIGNNTLIGEFVSIRDANHSILKGDYIRNQPMVSSPIKIEEDVWIGRGAVVLMGVTIGRGAVVGANAIVNKDVEPYTVVAGTPARVIKYRE